MPKWEYKHLDLHRGSNNQVEFFAGFSAALAAAGADGWEAIGQVNVIAGIGAMSTSIPVLVLKRVIRE